MKNLNIKTTIKKYTIIIPRITDIFVDAGILKHAIEVPRHEVPKSHWAEGLAEEPFQEKINEKLKVTKHFAYKKLYSFIYMV